MIRHAQRDPAPGPGAPGALARRPAAAAAHGLRLLALRLALPALLLAPGTAWGQGMGGLPGPLPGPPALPSTLPGGASLPAPFADPLQQEILQRILDAAAGRVAPPAGRGTPAQGAAAGAVPLASGRMVLPPPPSPSAAAAGGGAAFPAAPPGEEPLSPAEAFFAARDPMAAAGQPGGAAPPPLRQVGYEGLRGAAPPGGAPAAAAGLGFGALPDDYLLGRDDEVVLAFRGRLRQTFSLRVGRDGLLMVPDLAPVPAAGRSLRALRADLEARAARDLGGSEVFVSIGQVRQIAVFVGGEVARPGLVPLTAHASVLDALVAAGGVRRTGSLRAVRVEGGPEGPRRLDLYPVLAGGGGPAPDLALREGERIVVPPLGAVVAIGGEVTRPGVYELPAGTGAAPLPALLALAGQPLRPAGNRFLLHTTDAGGRRSVREIGPRDAVRRGDALRVEPGTDAVANQVRLVGHVAAPVLRSAEAATGAAGGAAAAAPARGGREGTGGAAGRALRGLLADPLLVRPDPYPLLAVVWRTDRRSRTRHFIPFDLARALADGGEAGAELALAEGDEVILLGMADIAWLSSPSVQQAIRGEAAAGAEAPPPGAAIPVALAGAAAGPVDCPALQRVALAAQSSRLRFAHARGAGFPDVTGRAPCPQVFQDYPALLPFLLDQAVSLSGEVRLPGLYPALPGTPLDALLAAAGGATEGADLAAVELAREPEAARPGGGPLRLTRTVLDLRAPGGGGPAAVRVAPRDALRVPRAEGERDLGPVTLAGEVVRPGTYEIRRGERLSEVIARAGGLTPQAYPYGTVFTRESVRLRQQEGFQRSARELEMGLTQVATSQAVAGSSRGGAVDLGGVIAAGRSLADALRHSRAAGRMVVEANPVVLAARPDLDVLLEPGDLIAVPKRPNEVTVVGSVLNPGSLQFASGWRAADYVRAAGGPQRFADGGRAFVVLPNGQSAPGGLGWFGDGGPPVPPGSLVVVPQDPSPFEFWGFLRDAAVSQLAVSAAALAVIARAGGR